LATGESRRHNRTDPFPVITLQEKQGLVHRLVVADHWRMIDKVLKVFDRHLLDQGGIDQCYHRFGSNVEAVHPAVTVQPVHLELVERWEHAIVKVANQEPRRRTSNTTT